jgi:UTP:GlnB (protein PII) uridylyltransferase
MPHRNLDSDELKHANELLAEIRKKLVYLSGGDPLLLFAYRRKIYKELGYDERGKPGERAKLKALKW